MQPDPPRKAPEPAELESATRKVMHFGLLMLASLVMFDRPLPWQAAALALVVAALVVGVRALIAVWRTGMRGVIIPALGVGLLLSGLMASTLTMMLAAWPITVERQECLAGALTISAKEGCESQYSDALQQSLIPGPAQG